MLLNLRSFGRRGFNITAFGDKPDVLASVKEPRGFAEKAILCK